MSTFHELSSARTLPARQLDSCDFCGDECRDPHPVGAQDACGPCFARLPICKRCKGVGDVDAGTLAERELIACPRCHGQGLQETRGCVYRGTRYCEDGDCLECGDRYVANVRDGRE